MCSLFNMVDNWVPSYVNNHMSHSFIVNAILANNLTNSILMISDTFGGKIFSIWSSPPN